MPSSLLKDVVVLDLGRVLAAPLVAQFLGDLGATVIKVERPGVGDDSRAYGPPFATDDEGGPLDMTAFFLAANRNKQSVTIDHAKPEGQDLIRSLAAKSHILVENFRVGTLQKYGLGYDALKAVNPALVYCSISGFGQTGPLSHRPGFDGIFQAMSGMMSVTGWPDTMENGGPLRVGISIVDVLTAYQATIGILAALRRAEACGEGQHIDIGLLDAGVSAVSHAAQLYLMNGQQPGRPGNMSFAGAPSGTFKCRTGLIYIVGATDQQFQSLCKAIDRPDMATDPRFQTIGNRIAHRPVLAALLVDSFVAKTAEEWDIILDQHNVPAGPVLDIAEAFASPQIRHREMQAVAVHDRAGAVALVANALKFSDTPIIGYSAPPSLGADTDHVLADVLDLDTDTIAGLRRKSVI